MTDPVVLELLVGARPGQLVPLRRMMNSFDHAAVQPRDDWEHAAELYRHCRSRGVTIRSLHDCLIAAVAIRTRTPLLHADRDFDRLAELTDLEVA